MRGTIEITRRVRAHTRISSLFSGTYSHIWVSPGPRVVLSVTFIPGFVVYKGLMISD